MKHFHFCYFADYALHTGSFWAGSRGDIEKMIIKHHPKADDIHIWIK
jgi:hypothetical protein